MPTYEEAMNQIKGKGNIIPHSRPLAQSQVIVICPECGEKFTIFLNIDDVKVSALLPMMKPTKKVI